MKSPRLMLASLALSLSIAAHAETPERVRVTTNFGPFVIELNRDRAPLTVENFLSYVREGHYSNTLFHRTIANFVIQGGGVGPDYKARPTRKPIANESGNGLRNVRGTVGLARASGPHSGDAQIYVNVADNPDLDPLPTRWGFAVFGQVVEGMEVIDRISVSPTGAMGPFKQDAPLQPVVIQKMEIIAETPKAKDAVPTSPESPEGDDAQPGADPGAGAEPPPPAAETPAATAAEAPAKQP